MPCMVHLSSFRSCGSQGLQQQPGRLHPVLVASLPSERRDLALYPQHKVSLGYLWFLHPISAGTNGCVPLFLAVSSHPCLVPPLSCLPSLIKIPVARMIADLSHALAT